MSKDEEFYTMNILEKALPEISNRKTRDFGVACDNFILRVFDALLHHKYDDDELLTPIHVRSSLDNDVLAFEKKIQTKFSCPHLKSALSYYVNELICNVEQHSRTDIGLGLVDFNPNNQHLFVGIADGGISIYGSYIRAQKYVCEIGDSDAQALFLAQNGYSTKNLPNAENRGYGISSNSKMIVDGLNGIFAILSGNALFYNSKKGKQIVGLPDDIVWPGTLFLAEIPVGEREFNLYDYIG